MTALNVEAIEAQYRIRRADRLPHVGVTAESASQRLPSDLAYNPACIRLVLLRSHGKSIYGAEYAV